MGCDIHMWAEIARRRNVDGVAKETWYAVGRIFENPYHDPKTVPFFYDDDGYESNSRLLEHPYRLRNYDLFAILADVRNGRGFAGVKTGDGFLPIAAPRGLPENVSKHVAKESREYGSDGHSHSWVLLDEAINFNWDLYTHKTGVVDPEQYIVFTENGKPNEWSGGVSGKNVQMLSNEAMKAYVEGPHWEERLKLEKLLEVYDKAVVDAREKHGPDSDAVKKAWDDRVAFYQGFMKDLPSYYTDVSWSASYRDCVGKEWFATLETLKTFGDPKDVRIVFFFDN